MARAVVLPEAMGHREPRIITAVHPGDPVHPGDRLEVMAMLDRFVGCMRTFTIICRTSMLGMLQDELATRVVPRVVPRVTTHRVTVLPVAAAAVTVALAAVLRVVALREAYIRPEVLRVDITTVVRFTVAAISQCPATPPRP
jgi:hypothetical protein